jgi:hypothetical protein
VHDACVLAGEQRHGGGFREDLQAGLRLRQRAPSAAAVLATVPLWVADYNESHPHRGLGMKSPREYRAANGNGGYSSPGPGAERRSAGQPGPSFSAGEPEKEFHPEPDCCDLLTQHPVRFDGGNSTLVHSRDERLVESETVFDPSTLLGRLGALVGGDEPQGVLPEAIQGSEGLFLVTSVQR